MRALTQFSHRTEILLFFRCETVKATLPKKLSSSAAKAVMDAALTAWASTADPGSLKRDAQGFTPFVTAGKLGRCIAYS